MPRALAGIRAIAPEFDDFIVDLWGVVHDGERPFEGVLGALEGLAGVGGKRVIFVTNTSRAGDAVIETLASRMGIDRALFHDVVSSGDVTRAALVARDPAVFGGLPAAPRCFHYGDASFVPWLFETGLTIVDDLAGADLIVASGAPRDAHGLDAAVVRLAPAAALRIPLVCTNPDCVIPSASGATIGPGAIARAYAELGGRAFLYGKPHPPIYEEARRRLGGTSQRRIVAIGDMLETDIRGARAAGLASILVTQTGARRPDDAERELEPDMVIDRFAW